MKQVITWHMSRGVKTLSYRVRLILAALLAALALPASLMAVWGEG